MRLVSCLSAGLTVITVEFLAGRLALGNTVFGRAIPRGGGRRSPEAG